MSGWTFELTSTPDPDKKKYFKVESSGTAPAAAAWSAENVKRRKLADEAEVAAQGRRALAETQTRRANILGQPLTGGFLARELGLRTTDVASESLARDFVSRGKVPLSDPRWSSSAHPHPKHMYIHGQHGVRQELSAFLCKFQLYIYISSRALPKRSWVR